MTKEEKDTKNKIIAAAGHLFAEKGFGSTSVREIANEAGANIAAVNYHFGSKDKLYWRVFEANFSWIQENVHLLQSEASSTEDLALRVFDFFIQNGKSILNTFKIFLSDYQIEGASALESTQLEQLGDMGPPGQEVFFQFMNKEFGENLSESSKMWAVKMIFSTIVHFAVVLNTKFMKEKMQCSSEMNVETLRKGVRHSVRAHLVYLKENHKELSFFSVN